MIPARARELGVVGTRGVPERFHTPRLDRCGRDAAGGGRARWGGPVHRGARLTERLVERAFETGARASPVEGAARGALAEAGGIAGSCAG